MKKIYLIALLLTSVAAVNAQDEGAILKKERLDLNKGFFVGLGPSFTLGKNIGDYSIGLNVEFGFVKRLNRVISIGPSVSYISFNYDPGETGYNNSFLSEEYINGNYELFRLGMYVDFDGGDLQLLSAAANIKINFVPVTDYSKFSVYGFVKPFVTMATRTEVKGVATVYAVRAPYEIQDFEEALLNSEQIPWEANDPAWQDLGVTISDDLKEDTRITGGVFVGPGIEFNPARKLSFYLQAAFGYTFPVSFVSTEKYSDNQLENVDEKYPMTEKGFPSLNVQAGVTFNF